MMMSLEPGIDESSQAPTYHGVAVYKNTATNQAYCFLSEGRRSLQFSAIHTSLWDVGYNKIHFLPFSLRENWRRYHPIITLSNEKAVVQGDLNKHAALLWIQDPQNIPL